MDMFPIVSFSTPIQHHRKKGTEGMLMIFMTLIDKRGNRVSFLSNESCSHTCILYLRPWKCANLHMHTTSAFYHGPFTYKQKIIPFSTL